MACVVRHATWCHLVLLRLAQSNPSTPAQACSGQAQAAVDGTWRRVWPKPQGPQYSPRRHPQRPLTGVETSPGSFLPSGQLRQSGQARQLDESEWQVDGLFVALVSRRDCWQCLFGPQRHETKPREFYVHFVIGCWLCRTAAAS